MKKTLILDSTQITNYLTCPRIWYYSDKRRLTPITAQPKEAMMMGSLGHKYLELYYKASARGEKLNNALDEAFALDIAAESKDVFDLSKPRVSEVQNRLRNYMFTYANGNDYIVPSPENVELGFSYKLYEDDEKLYILEGRIDLLDVSLKNFDLGYVDHKFQMRRTDLYEKSIQFKNYAMVLNARMAMINYIRFTKEINKDTFHRQPITFTMVDHEAWKARLISIYDRIHASLLVAEIDPNFWQTMPSQPNWASCSGKFGYKCDYTSLCEEPSAIALVKIDSMYTIRPEWNPW